MDKIKQIEQESKEYYEKWRDAEHRLAEEKLKKVNLDFVGKFVKYKDPVGGNTTYMYVRRIYEDKIIYPTQKYSYVVNGLGFISERIDYGNMTWFEWDCSKEFHVFGDNVAALKEMTDGITEISAEDFKEAYENTVSEMNRYHEQYFKAIVFGKNEDLTQE